MQNYMMLRDSGALRGDTPKPPSNFSIYMLHVMIMYVVAKWMIPSRTWGN